MLKQIKEPVKDTLAQFEKEFRLSMKSSVPLLDIITRYIVQRKGKQMRPLFVFLSAGICGEITPKAFRAASLAELLHTGTLLHDDVVDGADRRRGFFSLNALWGNKIAVLVGDYLLSRGLLLALKNKDYELLEIVSQAVREMSEGELLQFEKARKMDMDEDVYFEVIRKKTASLFAACCAAGAASAGASAEETECFRQLGEHIGIAFQIKDDLFDYWQNKNTQKPEGIDLKEKKMTLPLIYMLNNLSFVKRRKIIYKIKNQSENPGIRAEIIRQVYQSGGISYAEQKMEEYKDKALALLENFPNSACKNSFIKLMDYTVQREK